MTDIIDNSLKSPASVATDLIVSESAGEKIQNLPMFRSQFNRSASLPEDNFMNTTGEHDNENGETDATKDDIETRRPARSSLRTRKEMMASLKKQGGSNLAISESTRKILDQMSSRQVQDATLALEKVQETRRASGLVNMGSFLKNKRLSVVKEAAEAARRRSSGLNSLECLENELKDIESNFGPQAGQMGQTSVQRGNSIGKRSSDDCSGGGGGSGGRAERRYSKSVVPLDDLDDFDDEEDESTTDVDDSDRTRELNKTGVHGKGGERTFSKSMGAVGNISFLDNELSDDEDENEETETQDMDEQLKEVEAIADETFKRIVKRHSGEHSSVLNLNAAASIPKPESKMRRDTAPHASRTVKVEEEFKPEKLNMRTRRPGRERRTGIMSQSCSAADKVVSPAASLKGSPVWKPLSSVQQDFNDEEGYDSDEENKKLKKEKLLTRSQQQQKGFGSFWNKLTASTTSSSSPTQSPKTTSNKKENKQPKKDIDGATYFRKGKRRANKCEFLQAVALYNFALVRQRETHGENHIDCATTLNEIGVCWMMLGERYPALTAFEEALFIRQRELGHGAMEVAETTNNIWMILHEERQEIMEEQEA